VHAEAQSPGGGRRPSVARLAWAGALVLIAGAFVAFTFLRGGDWRTASREPVGLAPDPVATREAVIQVYGARTWGWKGFFGAHTWVAVKPTGAKSYTVYEVIGWRLRWGESVVVARERAPDERWFGSEPELLADRRGADVDALIARVEAAVQAYPYAGEYRLWPGPNSNTFTAWIGRAVPELAIAMPATAIGKDYLGGSLLSRPPSGRGLQLSLFGLLGLIVSRVEGLEVNVLGFIVGLNPLRPSLNLPIVGSLAPGR
jgi:hypothetical protein